MMAPPKERDQEVIERDSARCALTPRAWARGYKPSAQTVGQQGPGWNQMHCRSALLGWATIHRHCLLQS